MSNKSRDGPSPVTPSTRVNTNAFKVGFESRAQELVRVVRRVSGGHAVTDEDRVAFSFELQNFHAVSVDELARFFSTDVVRGVDEEAVAARLAEYGKNTIPPPKELPLAVKFFLAFFSGFAPLLWVSAFFVFLSWQPFGTPPGNEYNLDLAIVLLVVIFVSALFSFYQDFQTSQVLAGFTSLIPAACQVIRSGKTIQCNPEDLVPGT
jgi:magnesium-transporting ATPase (P-type)